MVYFGVCGRLHARLDLRFYKVRGRSASSLVQEVTDWIEQSTITCPNCAHQAIEQMPTDVACQLRGLSRYGRLLRVL